MSRYNKESEFSQDNLKGVIKNMWNMSGMFRIDEVMYLDGWETLASIDYLEEIGIIKLVKEGPMTQYNVYEVII